MKKRNRFFLALISVLYVINAIAADTTTVTSPDKRITFKLFRQKNQLSYKITFEDITIIEPSPIIASLDHKLITNSVKINQVTNYAIKETYPWWGVHSTAINECNGIRG